MLGERITERLRTAPDGYLPLCDGSSPETIRAEFSCSKKDFKKAIGNLYRDRVIEITSSGIRLLK